MLIRQIGHKLNLFKKIRLFQKTEKQTRKTSKAWFPGYLMPNFDKRKRRKSAWINRFPGKIRKERK